MPVSTFFAKCFPCCDSNKDGQLSWKEVTLSAKETLDFLSSASQTLAIYALILQAAGIEMRDVEPIFLRLNEVIVEVKAQMRLFDDVQVSVVAGDLNGDGKVNRDDVRMYFEAGKKICDAISSRGVAVDEMNKISQRLDGMIAAIALLPLLLDRPQPAAAPATVSA